MMKINKHGKGYNIDGKPVYKPEPRLIYFGTRKKSFWERLKTVFKAIKELFYYPWDLEDDEIFKESDRVINTTPHKIDD